VQSSAQERNTVAVVSEQRPAAVPRPDCDALARQQVRWRAIHALVAELEDLRRRMTELERAKEARP
jgi:hypothetical protein